MAERRMFAKSIIDSDAFLEMPQSSQNLYFHLSMRADDDGFINNPKSIMRAVGCNDDDIKLLISKKFVIPFENGIVVIKHWKIHNYIRKDTYTETKYKDEKALLELDNNNAYTLPLRVRDECVTGTLTQDRLGKDRLGKDRIEYISESDKPINTLAKKIKHKYGEYYHVLLSDDEVEKLNSDYGEAVVLSFIKKVDEYCQQYGKKYKDYNLTIRKWIVKDKPKEIKNYGTVL